MKRKGRIDEEASADLSVDYEHRTAGISPEGECARCDFGGTSRFRKTSVFTYRKLRYKENME